MKYDVYLTPQAQSNIYANARWWERERSAEQAAHWYDGVMRTINTLDENPRRCSRCAETDTFAMELRELHFGLGSSPTHRIVFTIVDKRVIVVSVRHVSRGELRPKDIDLQY